VAGRPRLLWGVSRVTPGASDDPLSGKSQADAVTSADVISKVERAPDFRPEAPTAKVTSVRVMTYNVHSCRGGDRRLLPERILSVVQSGAPDIVALQELDVGQSRSHALDQAAYLAEGLRMEFHFVAARACHGGHYGNAILSRMPISSYRSSALPQLDDRCEPRAVQRVRLEGPWGPMDVFNVHFGLSRRERRMQVEMLLSSEWLGDTSLGPQLIVCGDFNAAPGSFVYGRMARALRDAQSGRARATFPAFFPLVRLDHVFVGPGLSVHRTQVLRSPLARVASDHRPLLVDVEPSKSA
jgi:endonuclease/exonuclease/phosphatase family metal-dependent hydrolase